MFHLHLHLPIQRYSPSVSVASHSRKDDGPTVLIIKDKEGYVYGGYASQTFERHGDFYGDMKSFLFQLYPKASIFSPTGTNKNLQWAHLVSKGICRGYPLVFNGESSSAQTSSEIPNIHVRENPIKYADLRDMLHDMFPIQDMASKPMEEVPIVQQPTKGPAEGPNEDALRL
ncbi:hypothetical protein SO802_028942 [Lithocarpus litseifolius]|uniref:TLDc domain-containing protein n=1 Tax=Lithocarpus litseifolius TaxID=425828 RepID=A0AAW2BSP0_9ROSI